MRVLALYNDDDGEAKSTVVTLLSPDGTGVDLDLLSAGGGIGLHEQVGEALSNYNDSGGLFIVAIGEGERPDVIDQNGDEVGADFIELTLS